MAKFDSILGTVGNTPIVRINNLTPRTNVNLYVKIEAFNPLGSVKDRLALGVIEAAEKAGRVILETYLSPNRTFVDLPELINEMDPLRDFSEACRRELQSSHGR